VGRDRALAQIAQRQYGVFSGPQALASGFSRRAISGAVARGEWLRGVGDTFALSGVPRTWQQGVVGAYLAVGAPCAVSHLHAAAWWGLGIEPPPVPTITVPWTRRPRLTGVNVVRTRRWGRLDVVRSGPVHSTSPARTLLDITPLLDRTALEIALDTAHRKRLVDIVRLERTASDAARAKVQGAAELRGLVRLRDPAKPIESAAETLLRTVLRRFNLPLPEPQLWLVTRNGRRRVDNAYREERVAIEVVSYEWHDGRLRFDDDKIRDSELADLGWDRRYITWSLLNESPAEAAWTIARAIDLEPATWRRARP